MSDFLKYIETQMIVTDKAKRDRSPIVKKRLDELFQKCKTDSQYALSPYLASRVPNRRSSVMEATSHPRKGRNSADQSKEKSRMSRWKRWMCL